MSDRAHHSKVRMYCSILQLTPRPVTMELPKDGAGGPPDMASTFQQLRVAERKMTGHCISFLQYGAEAMAEAHQQLVKGSKSYPQPEDIGKFVKIVFLGPNNALRDIRVGDMWMQPELLVDFDNVIAWLQMLKTIGHPEYRDIVIDTSPAMRTRCERIPMDLTRAMEVVTDPALITLHMRIQVQATGHG